jgi:hypothetical protein
LASIGGDWSGLNGGVKRGDKHNMMNIVDIQQRLFAKGASFKEIRALETTIRIQLVETGRYIVQAAGGWVFGERS